MKFAKGAVKAIEKGKDYTPNKAEVPILPLVPDDEEYEEEDVTKCGSFKLFSNPADANSAKYIFRMGYADGTQSVRFHLKWYENTTKVLRGMRIQDGANQAAMVDEMCRGPIRAAFRNAVDRLRRTLQRTRAEAAVQAEPPQDVANGETQAEYEARCAAAYQAVLNLGLPDPTVDHVTEAIQSASGCMVPYKGLEKQKRFMRRKMRKPVDMPIRQYVNHLKRMNDEELPYLPPYAANQNLSDDEITDIIMFGIPKTWTKEMDKQDFDPFRAGVGLRQLTEFCERIEATEDAPTVTRNNTTSNKKAKTTNGSKGKSDKSDKSSGKYCVYHESTSHDTSECETLKQLKAKGKNPKGSQKNESKGKSWTKQSSDAKKFTKKELTVIVKKASDKAFKKAKKELNSVAKRKKDDSDDDDKSVESINVTEIASNDMKAKLDKINRDMADVDAQLKKFDFGEVNEVDV